jgi:hypothetical protein
MWDIAHDLWKSCRMAVENLHSSNFYASIRKGLSYLSVNNKLSISVIPACMLINLPAAYSNICV